MPKLHRWLSSVNSGLLLIPRRLHSASAAPNFARDRVGRPIERRLVGQRDPRRHGDRHQGERHETKDDHPSPRFAHEPPASWDDPMGKLGAKWEQTGGQIREAGLVPPCDVDGVGKIRTAPPGVKPDWSVRKSSIPTSPGMGTRSMIDCMARRPEARDRLENGTWGREMRHSRGGPRIPYRFNLDAAFARPVEPRTRLFLTELRAGGSGGRFSASHPFFDASSPFCSALAVRIVKRKQTHGVSRHA